MSSVRLIWNEMASCGAPVAIVEGQTLENIIAAGRRLSTLFRLGTCPQLFGTRIKVSLA